MLMSWPAIAPDGFRRQRDAHLEQALLHFADGLHPADDLASARIRLSIADDRHLDALLDRDGLRPRVDRSGVAADVVDRLQTRGHGCSDLLTALPATIEHGAESCRLFG